MMHALILVLLWLCCAGIGQAQLAVDVTALTARVATDADASTMQTLHEEAKTKLGAIIDQKIWLEADAKTYLATNTETSVVLNDKAEVIGFAGNVDLDLAGKTAADAPRFVPIISADPTVDVTAVELTLLRDVSRRLQATKDAARPIALKAMLSYGVGARLAARITDTVFAGLTAEERINVDIRLAQPGFYATEIALEFLDAALAAQGVP